MNTQPVSPERVESARNSQKEVHAPMEDDAIGRTHSTWMGLFKRCFNPVDRNFPRYGGRGITVCERWYSFDAFVEDMGLRPHGTSLDRVDNNGNYEPSNCRWATPKQQARNTRRNRVTIIDGVPKFHVEIADEFGLNPSTIHRRAASGQDLTSEAYFKRFKLNREEVVEIKTLLARKIHRAKIADRFAVSVQTVGMIARGETWRDVES